MADSPCQGKYEPTYGLINNSVEKLFQIEINHDIVALGDVSLRLGYRLMSRASRTESVTVLGKR